MKNNFSIDDLCVNAIRFLSIDAVEKAKSGHPGTPMGTAALAYVLWDRSLKFNPLDPKWPDRDRFVLSCGHASMLLYSLLHLTGYDLSIDDIKQFRQWGSRTPGHPEYGLTQGVEATTGPLGQGFGNAIGMAIAERSMAERYNRPGFEIFNHYTYALVSDGDLQEGVSAEAASLAGTMQLGKVVFLYDDNDISIEGKTSIAFAENVAQRFQAYGWHVIGPIDGLDMPTVDVSIRMARAETHRPSLIVCHTIIGYGSPNKAGTAAAHGEPLGEEEVKLTREKLGWHYPPFVVPPEAVAHMRQAIDRGRKAQTEWQQKLKAYREAYPEDYQQLERDLSGDLPEGWDEGLDKLFAGQKEPIATRDASGKVMNAIAPKLLNLWGGSADLAPSTKTLLKRHDHFYGFEEFRDPNLHFGVREHAMGAITNGMALHGGIIPYGATFLAFYDYMRPPVRLAALMGIRNIFIYTHDSVGLGEDGPTHQPIEQLLGLRSVPNLVTIRPCDGPETTEAWRVALERRDGPTALILTRQKVPVLDRSELASAEGLRRGGYILWEASDQPQAILIATGSEVSIALDAAKQLKAKGVNTRVVSLPSWELFRAQTHDYQDRVLPPTIRARISVEASTPLGWREFVGLDGIAIGVCRFGASAPGQVIYEKLELTPDKVVHVVADLLRPGGSHGIGYGWLRQDGR